MPSDAIIVALIGALGLISVELVRARAQQRRERGVARSAITSQQARAVSSRVRASRRERRLHGELKRERIAHRTTKRALSQCRSSAQSSGPSTRP